MTEAAVAIIGAGMAGLACARVLFGAQQSVTVLEKSRGLGGRLATRRIGRLAFDHGAQYVVARDAALKDYLELASQTGYVSAWAPATAGVARIEPWLVGSPGMSALVKPLAAGLDVRSGLHVRACEWRAEEWWLKTEDVDEVGPFAALVLAVPAPQAIEMTRNLETVDVEQSLSQVRMAPCWAAMVAFDSRFAAPAEVLRDAAGPLSWAARDVGKPGRRSPHDCWILHASTAWTREHIDDAPAAVAAALLREFENLVGTTPKGAYLSAHLWRYAHVEQALGRPYVWYPELQLGLCGDWCLGARVEAAWMSGTAMARQVLASLQGP
jgi:renalase